MGTAIESLLNILISEPISVFTWTQLLAGIAMLQGKMGQYLAISGLWVWNYV